MSLIVEDGSGVTGAESYITVADTDTYHSLRRNTTWTGGTPIKEGALRRATDYMVQTYRHLWKGTRMTQAQVLDWPRGYVYTQPFLHGALGAFPYLVPDDIVPDLVKHACAELALRALAGSLSEDLAQQVKSERVGPLEVVYDNYSPQRKRYAAVDAMLAEFLTSTGNVRTRVVRA